MGLHLHEDLDGLLVLAIDPGRGIGEEAAPIPALDDGGVVLVGREDIGRRDVGRMADHLEERVSLRLAVDVPAGVEDLVPTMLGVGLREHHQLDIGRIALERREAASQIGDLVGREGETQLAVGLRQRRLGVRTERDPAHRPRFCLGEKLLGVGQVEERHLGHAVVKDRGGMLHRRRVECPLAPVI
jgi:hypothetical protein